MRDLELIEGARAIASDVQLPSGRQAKLARIIDRHLDWFAAARARGLGWDDVIEMLFVAGVTRDNGLRLTRGHLSSLVWRKLKERAAGGAPLSGPALIRSRDGSAVAGPDVQKRRCAQEDESPFEAAAAKRPKVQPRAGATLPSPPTSPAARRIARDDAGASRSSLRADPSTAGMSTVASSCKAEDILAFMRRSAAVRRKPEHD